MMLRSEDREAFLPETEMEACRVNHLEDTNSNGYLDAGSN